MTSEPITPISAQPRTNALALYFFALAGVIACYSAYAMFAVPWIEGPRQIVKQRAIIPLEELPSPRDQKQHLIPYLPADAWELEECKTLLIDAGTILFKDLEQQDDGTVEISPFTLISSLNSESATSSEDQLTPTVLRCLSGATIRFNKPVQSLFSGNGKIESARLKDRVDIYRPASSTDPDDGIHVVTSNVKIDKKRIYALEEVQFSFGPHHGSGRNMLIDLAYSAPAASVADFSDVKGIRRLELAFLDQLRIQPVQKTDSAEMTSDIERQETLFSGTEVPLDVTCQGPFVFDFESRTASFEDQVIVQQDDEFQDKISCNRLLLSFEETETEPAIDGTSTSQPTDGLEGKFQLKHFVAEGSPAVVIARSRSTRISGEYLSYNVAIDQVFARCRLNSNEKVTIVSPEHQLVAKQLTYNIPEDGSLGEINIEGPGRVLRIAAPNRDEFFATWQTRLNTRNLADQPGLQRVVVDGAAQIRIADTTQVEAERLEMLVWQVAQVKTDNNGVAKREWVYRPAKLTTTGDVSIKSPKLEGRADHLTATWHAPRETSYRLTPGFRSGNTHHVGYRPRQETQFNQNLVSESTARPGSFVQQSTFEAVVDNRIGSTPGNGFVEQAGPAKAHQISRVVNTGFQEDERADKPHKKLIFDGETVDVRLIGSGDEASVSDLTIVGNVTIVEQTSVNDRAAQDSLRITGHRLQMSPQSKTDNYRSLISGKEGEYASVTSKELNLKGANINLDQAANKIWVEGAGVLNLKADPSNRDAQLPGSQPGQARTVADARNLEANWRGGMIFDGAKIYFERGVVLKADQPSQEDPQDKNTLNIKTYSEALSVELSHPIRFEQVPDERKSPEVRELVFVDQVNETKQVFKFANHSIVNQAVDKQVLIGPSAKRPVIIEIQTIDKQGKLVEQQKFSVPQAVVNIETGSIKSKGPGSISIHRLAKSTDQAMTQPVNPLAKLGPAKDGALSFIQIDFDGELKIDAERKEMVLAGNIRTIYVPVDDWETVVDPDHPQRVSGSVFLTCEKLLLAQWTQRATTEKTNEMVATGNSRILSDTFEATADRVSYTQATDILNIVGTPRSNANLYFKQTPNDTEPTHLIAERITYRIGDQRTETHGVKNLNIKRN